jgi:heterodisulfide reductase subunit A
MAEAGRHPNIRVLANTDIESVEGEAGDFTVTVTRRPRYVNEELCTGCRTCSNYCPQTAPNPFEENLVSARAIDIWCAQSIPACAVVNREACLYFQGKCTICMGACKAQAIDFSQKRKKGVMHVGAIIVSPGYEIFDAKTSKAYGYGRLKNVMTSLEFERILSASGPNKGEILRRSDGKIPSKIAWLQCVGSRDARVGHTYCSGICCTYAIKQMMLVKSHYPKIEVTIFHNDIRSFGKGFEDFYNRARKMQGARFVRRRISSIKENKRNNNLLVTYVSDGHSIQQEEFEMAVLSVGMSPSKGNKELSEIFGLELNGHGYCRTDPFSPAEIAGRPGIFAAATFTGPMDIPDSVSSASGAGAAAAQLLSTQRGSLTQKKMYPKERSVAGEAPKIGVFVCHCGTNIAGVADVSSLVKYASKLENVGHCEDYVVSCASDALKKISKAIKEKKLNRVVVAACSPKDHEAAFREALREGGLNPYLLDMANIREQCTWVHAQNKGEASEKAEELIAMAVARARHLSPIEELSLPVNKRGLVLGGGSAGMKTALSLARQGFEVYLIEKESQLGGQLTRLHYTLEGMEVQPFLRKLIAEVEKEQRIKVFLGYELKSFAGYVGNFKSTIAKVGEDAAPVELEHGIVIIATGGKLLTPSEYKYGQSKKIVSQQELESMIASKTLPEDLKEVAMIQCVGARSEERPYCSRICCGEAIKNALKLKELDENVDVTVFYRDMRSYGFREDSYLQAREKGVLFIQYEPEKKPEVELKGEDLSLTFYDSTLAMQGESNPDLLVLSTPVIAEGNQELSQLLRVPITGDGFFMEAHMKLRPLDLATDGIFLCGMAHYPKYIPEAISQANGAALRAATILSQDSLITSGAVCEVDEDLCIACGACVAVCKYGAINVQAGPRRKRAVVNPALCKGDGLCNSKCPMAAVSLKHFVDDGILAQIEAAASDLVGVSDSGE